MEALSDVRLQHQIAEAERMLTHIRQLSDDLAAWTPTVETERQMTAEIARKLRIAEDRWERRRKMLDRL